MKNTKIEWADHTFNAWSGCTKVSPACAHCYAESLAKRNTKVYGQWGPGAPRKRTSDDYWKQPLKWNAEVKKYSFLCLDCKRSFANPDTLGQPWACPHCGQTLSPFRRRVFVNSLSDWLDDEVPIKWLADLLKLIHDCPHLDFLLLTKRPENWHARVSQAQGFSSGATGPDGLYAFLAKWLCGVAPANVWIGTTVENQEWADKRIPALLQIPARVRFLSCEPLLSALDLRLSTLDGQLHWVICGGESGPGARPMHPDWARSLRDQCQAAGVPFFFKQWGNHAPWCVGMRERALVDVHRERGMERRPCFSRRTDYAIMAEVSKKAAGRLLDGREWNEVPS